METSLFIYGRHPIVDKLHREPDKIDKLFIRDTLSGGGLQEVLRLASEHRIPVQRVPGRKLSELVGAVNDQGFVAQVSPVSYLEMDEWLETVDTSTKPLVLVLDEIEDPHNFGAMLRTAAAIGATAVIVPKHRQAPINATVVKTSAGTAGMVPVVRVVNINSCIRDLQSAGFWIYALDQDAEESVWEHKFDSACALIVGSEGKGIREKTLELSDFKLRLPMAEGVESLNASVSAALVMYEWLRQRSS
jgi:23S rRNA (guanosine2251-2'-O)-methyltransferase